MGFTVVGPNRFLGSGHPDLTEMREEGLPSRLGLIESHDAGESWGNVALLGEADFHVLRSAGARVYGYDASNDRLLASDDEGRGWRELDKPGQLVDIAVDPRTPGRLLATAVGGGADGTFESRDNGKTWTRLTDVVGLLAWRAPDRLYLIDGAGRVYLSRDGGRRLAKRGEIGGQPAALLGDREDELYVALHDGTIKHSVDGGITWIVRSRP